MTAKSKSLRDDPKVAAAIQREVDKAPTSIPDDALDLLRRLGCPATRRQMPESEAS